ncbi:MAG TPA: protein kinase, partial [Archangium sp.]|nr:protein kinase [Archangium sp.]
VYRARRSGRLYAIKLVRLDPRGDREAAALRLMRHPNVVAFHGYGLWPEDEPRFLVLALELVEGRPLDVWMRERNPSALELVRQVLLPLVHALGVVHAAGVVHRDVKESNILIRDSDGQPVLVDFGAAGFEGATRLTAVLPPGTPEYRSPEALRFVRESDSPGPYPAGPADDLWALGVVLYVLLTRSLPFGDRQSPGMVHAILYAAPKPPQALNPRVPEALSELCLCLLEKHPEARYASAEELAEALEELEQEASGDDAWKVPLFPGGQRQKSVVPEPRSPRTPRRWGWFAAMALVVACGAGVLFLRHAREALPPPVPTPQVASSQEMAPVVPPEDGGHGEVGEQSPTPAPIARAENHEEPAMIRSKKARSVAAACLVAGSGCVSGPPPRPTPENCPPGSQETHKRFQLEWSSFVLIPPVLAAAPIQVREGELHDLHLGWKFGTLPEQTRFSGHISFGKDRAYGLLTRAYLPDGESVPVCLEMMRDGEPGTIILPNRPNSTSKHAWIPASITVKAVR